MRSDRVQGVLSRTPARPIRRAPRPSRHLHALALRIGELCGLAGPGCEQRDPVAVGRDAQAAAAALQAQPRQQELRVAAGPGLGEARSLGHEAEEVPATAQAQPRCPRPGLADRMEQILGAAIESALGVARALLGEGLQDQLRVGKARAGALAQEPAQGRREAEVVERGGIKPVLETAELRQGLAEEFRDLRHLLRGVVVEAPGELTEEESGDGEGLAGAAVQGPRPGPAVPLPGVEEPLHEGPERGGRDVLRRGRRQGRLLAEADAAARSGRPGSMGYDGSIAAAGGGPGPSPGVGRRRGSIPMGQEVRVLLADDHGLMRAGLRHLLEGIRNVSIVAEAEDGRQAVSFVRDHEPDLVLLDIALPELNGLEACARIKQRFPDVAVLMLSMYSSEEYVLRALRNGALGYLLKSATAAELEVAIAAALRGDRYLSPEVSGHVIDAFVSGRETPRSPLDTLTSRQREILQLIAEGHTTREIAEILHLSAKTVETHRTNMMRELGLHEVVSLVRFAIRNGLVVDDAPDVGHGS